MVRGGRGGGTQDQGFGLDARAEEGLRGGGGVGEGEEGVRWVRGWVGRFSGGGHFVLGCSLYVRRVVRDDRGCFGRRGFSVRA